jgi:hypothetical protein
MNVANTSRHSYANVANMHAQHTIDSKLSTAGRNNAYSLENIQGARLGGWPDVAGVCVDGRVWASVPQFATFGPMSSDMNQPSNSLHKLVV